LPEYNQASPPKITWLEIVAPSRVQLRLRGLPVRYVRAAGRLQPWLRRRGECVYIPLPTKSMLLVGPRGRGYWGGLRSRYGRLGLKGQATSRDRRGHAGVHGPSRFSCPGSPLIQGKHVQVSPDALDALPGTAAGPPPLSHRRWAAAAGPPPLDWERVHCGTQGRDTRPRPQARAVCVQEKTARNTKFLLHATRVA
jgi:hypothetical protein